MFSAFFLSFILSLPAMHEAACQLQVDYESDIGSPLCFAPDACKRSPAKFVKMCRSRFADVIEACQERNYPKAHIKLIATHNALEQHIRREGIFCQRGMKDCDLVTERLFEVMPLLDAVEERLQYPYCVCDLCVED